MTRAEYVITNNEDEVIFRGYVEDVAKHFNTSKNNIGATMSCGYKLLGKYGICKVEDYKQDRLNNLIEHLTKYGNTCLNYEPTRFVEKLRDNGIEIRWHRAIDKDDNGEFKGYYYIIERTN